MDKDSKEKEVKHECCDCSDWKAWHHHHHHRGGAGGGGAIYGLGLFGAGFYFLQHAATFSDVVWGILKALVWPAFAVFKLFTLWKI